MTAPTEDSIRARVQKLIEKQPNYLVKNGVEYVIMQIINNRIFCPILTCDKHFSSDTGLFYHLNHHEHDVIDPASKCYRDNQQELQATLRDFEYSYANDLFPIRKELCLFYHEGKKRQVIALYGKGKEKIRMDGGMPNERDDLSVGSGQVSMTYSNTPVSTRSSFSMPIITPRFVKRRKPDGVWLPIKAVFMHENSVFDRHAKKIPQKIAYPNWRPKMDKCQIVHGENELRDYLPSFTPNLFDLSFVSLQGETSQPLSMDLFETAPIPFDNEGYVINVGATVWGLDWCPQPSSYFPETTEKYQYLAIGGYRKIGESQTINAKESGKGNIQIWNIGPVSDDRLLDRPMMDQMNDVPESSYPKLEMVIIHDDGCIWDLKWCPTNACDLPSLKFSENGVLPRLGLLAAAFGYGSIKVFSVPYPAQLKENLSADLKIETDYLAVRLPPVYSISLFTAAMWNISWSMDENHSFIAAGCTDGNIAVWSLNNMPQFKKPIHFEDEDDDEVINAGLPIHFFKGHELAVRSVDFCPYNQNLLMSCSHDGQVQIWDLRDPHMSIFSLKMRAFPMSVKWPDGSDGVLYTDGENGCRFIYLQNVQNGVLHTKKVCDHASPIWQISTSPHHPIVATSGSDGTIRLTYMLEKQNRSKRKAKDVVLFQLFNRPENAMSNDADSTASKSIYSLSFMDRLDLESLTGRAPLINRELAFQRVSWNPNLECVGWIAASNTLGIIRVQKARFED